MTQKEQLERLKKFANDIMMHIDDSVEIKFKAIQHGLLTGATRYQPCGDECMCDHQLRINDHDESFKTGIKCGHEKADWLIQKE